MLRPASFVRSPRPLAVIAAAAGVAVIATSAPVSAAPEASATYAKTLGRQALAQTNPGGVALDPAGNLYVANTGNDTVAKYAKGAARPTWTVGKRGVPAAQGGLSEPRDVAYLGGKVYVAQPEGGVQVLDAATGRWLRTLGRTFRIPIGVSTGVLANGAPALIVSNGQSGAVDILDASERLVRTIPERAAGSGTRDADTDAAGNVYIADYRNHRINKYSPTGQFLTSWTGGAGCDIPKPYGVEVDDRGRVFVAASNNNRIRVFDTSGRCLTTYGQNGSGLTRLSQLRRVAVGSGASPQVYAADLWGLKILVYNANGTLARRIGDGTYPAAGGLNEVNTVAVDSRAVYATDVNNHRITVWRTGGGVSAFGVKGRGAGKAAFNWPKGVGLDPRNGKVWVGDTHSENIKEFPAFGATTSLRQFDGGTPKFQWPGPMVIDPAGNIYVAELAGDRISAFTPTLTRRWTATGLANIQGLTWDPVGKRLIATAQGARPVIAVNPATGATSALAITTGSGTTRLGPLPGGVAVDRTGRIWVADTAKDRVVLLTGTGAYGGYAFGAFGRGNGQFNTPMGLAFGPDGKLYVADSGNSRVQVFTVR